VFIADSDRAWSYFGEKDPYFGVLTKESYRAQRLSADAKQEFFASGDDYVGFIVRTLRDHLGVSIEGARGLDFGCGVGRLTIPFARVCGSMIGVDVSEGMLLEARRNCDKQGIKNTSFVKSDDKLSAVSGPLQFVHSFIVFQHIPRARGEAILRRLVDLLEPDGIGALHFTTSWSTSTPLSRRLLTAAYETFPLLHAARNAIKGADPREPMMQMNQYNLNRNLAILQEAGCHRVHVRFTETGHYGYPYYGAILLFQKHPLDVRAYA
jgi:2-polyprenyl-3-methyl-5-hydroxy-6-metoxy-1,4-benzoquinol methylase